MFTLAFDRQRQALLARFSGVLRSEDMAGLDAAVVALIAREGPCMGSLISGRSRRGPFLSASSFSELDNPRFRSHSSIPMADRPPRLVGRLRVLPSRDKSNVMRWPVSKTRAPRPRLRLAAASLMVSGSRHLSSPAREYLKVTGICPRPCERGYSGRHAAMSGPALPCGRHGAMTPSPAKGCSRS
jgi:hypothetical protein